MGSTMAWWLAALDERVKVTVDICCLTDFHTLLAKKALGLHGVYYYVPALLEHFTTSQINALIAPRAHLGLAGLKDELTPVEGLDIIDRELQRCTRRRGIRNDGSCCATMSGIRKRPRAAKRCWLPEAVAVRREGHLGTVIAWSDIEPARRCQSFKGAPRMAKYGKKASEKVEKVMHERKKGTLRSGGSGKTVTSRKQAIAIGLSEARAAGGKVPAKKTSARKATKKR